MRVGTAIAGALALAIPAAATAQQQPEPIELLAASDAVRARAQASGDPVLLLAALTLLADATGHVFRPGGAPADVGYQQLWAEAERAVRGKPALEAALAKLPAPDRGAGWRSQVETAERARGWSSAIRYDGGEDAMLYVRSLDRGPLNVSVRAANGATLCNLTRANAVCRWPVARTQDYRIRVTTPGGERRGFELFTN